MRPSNAKSRSTLPSWEIPRVEALYQCRLVLVRPIGHVAWRRNTCGGRCAIRWSTRIRCARGGPAGYAQPCGLRKAAPAWMKRPPPRRAVDPDSLAIKKDANGNRRFPSAFLASRCRRYSLAGWKTSCCLAILCKSAASTRRRRQDLRDAAPLTISKHGSCRGCRAARGTRASRRSGRPALPTDTLAVGAYRLC